MNNLERAAAKREAVWRMWGCENIRFPLPASDITPSDIEPYSDRNSYQKGWVGAGYRIIPRREVVAFLKSLEGSEQWVIHAMTGGGQGIEPPQDVIDLFK